MLICVHWRDISLSGALAGIWNDLQGRVACASGAFPVGG